MCYAAQGAEINTELLRAKQCPVLTCYGGVVLLCYARYSTEVLCAVQYRCAVQHAVLTAHAHAQYSSASQYATRVCYAICSTETGFVPALPVLPYPLA
eukprot:488319-Rhodomonas_salina.6